MMEQQNINKELFMQFVSKMYDLGGKISLHIYSGLVTEEEAQKTAQEFAELVGSDVEEIIGDKNRWYSVEKKHSIAVFHNNSKDNRVQRIKQLEQELAELKKEEEAIG